MAARIAFLGPPQRQQRAGDAPAGGAVVVVVGEVGGEAGAVVGAGGGDHARPPEGASVLGHGLGLDGALRPQPAADGVLEVEVGVGADQALRQGRRLGQEVPVVVGQRLRPVGPLGHLERGHPVEHGEAAHPLGLIQRQAVGDPAAAVVAGEPEAFEAEVGHDLDHVAGHRPFGVALVPRVRRGPGAVAVAPEVGHHDREALGEPGRHPVPGDVALGEAVQKCERWARAPHHEMDLGALGGDSPGLEALEHGLPSARKIRRRRA